MLPPPLIRRSLPRWPFGLLSLAWMGALYWMSELPPSTVSTGAPGPLGNFLHVGTGAALAVLVLRALGPLGALFERRCWPGLVSGVGRVTLLVVLLHGVFDETHQFYSGRTCSVFDVLLDTGGALLVLLVPLAGAPGRPRSWRPAALVLALLAGLAVLGYYQRPWPDRLLEHMLQ